MEIQITQIETKLPDNLPPDTIFAKMSDEERRGLLKLATTKKLSRGDVLYEQGEIGLSLAIITNGLFKICVYSSEGKEIVFDYVGKGNVIGEISLFDGKPRTASVIAVESGEVLVLQKSEVLPYLQHHGDTALKIIAWLCERLRKTDALIEQNMSLAMEPKLARGLLRLASDHGKENQDGTIDVKIRQSDVGSYVSLARENVNRQLREWADSGIVELTRGHIIIRDQDALEDIAHDLE